MTKVCSKCGEEKPSTSEFYSKRKRKMKDGSISSQLHSRCRKCRSEDSKVYRLNPSVKEAEHNRYKLNYPKIAEKAKIPEIRKAKNESRNKKYRENPLKNKDKHLKYIYGISLDEYNLILSSQGGRCAICKTDKNDFDKRTGNIRKFSVDHDHISGKIRGLLCNRCNIGIGNLQDSPTVVKSALDYLRRK